MSKSNGKKFISKKGNKSKQAYEPKSTTKGNMDARECELDRVDSKHESRSNPAEWYIPNETILRNVANLPFGAAVGARRDFGDQGEQLNRAAVPGIATIILAPTMGASRDYNSPINISTRNLYSYLRQQQTGTRNYDAVDLGIYLGAMDSALSFLSWMRRIYGLMGLNNVVNRYVPYATVRSLNVNYDDILRHMADLRAYINQFAFRLSAMCVPAHLTFFARHMWLYDGLYLDDENGKSQMYMFKPYGFWHFDLSDGTGAQGPEGAGYLRMQPMEYIQNGDYEITFDDIVTRGEQIVNPILSGVGMEDFNIISADILKAYGSNGVFRATMIPDDYVVLPSHDETVLQQIQNTVLIGRAVNFNNSQFNIYQSEDVSYLIDPLTWTIKSVGFKQYGADKLLNAYDSVPSPEYVIDATRLMPSLGVTQVSDTATRFTVESCGSEIALQMNLWHFGYDTDSNWVLNKSDDYTYVNVVRFHIDDGASGIASKFAANANQFAKISNFRRHPFMLNVVYDSSESAPYYAEHFYGDVSNYAIVTDEMLRNMHQAATLKQFGVEMYGARDV